MTLELTAGIMAIGTALCWLIPGGLIGLFTENPETVTIGITDCTSSVWALFCPLVGDQLRRIGSAGTGHGFPGDLRDAVCGGDHPCGICAEPPDRRHRCVVGICLHGERDCGGGVCVVPQGVEESVKRSFTPRHSYPWSFTPRHSQNRSSRLSDATQLPFAHEMALPRRFARALLFTRA